MSAAALSIPPELSDAAPPAAATGACVGCHAPLPDRPKDAGWWWKRIWDGRWVWHCPECWIASSGPQARFLALTCFEALYGGAAGGGKALVLDTPIPVPSGWATMGALRVGDIVFADDGSRTEVLACSEVMHGRPCFEVEFSDGARLVADADHLWATMTYNDRLRATHRTETWRAARRSRRPSRATGNGGLRGAITAARNATRAWDHKEPPASVVRSTREIAETLVARRTHHNHSIAVAGPIELPDLDLPIDPYLLGVWLGDGTSSSGAFTSADQEIADAVMAGGYEVRKSHIKYGWRTKGFSRPLRLLGVLNNKHIPTQYLRASAPQRLALLQGLMDTDGYASPEDGACEFTTTNRALRDGTLELILSLGIKATACEGRATLYGRDISAKWRILFVDEKPIFRLARKLALQKRSGFRGTHAVRYIVAVRPVESVPVRCIAVAAPSHCFLAGREMIPTHNSDALLVDAIRYVGRGYGRNYSALLLRREMPDLKLSLIPRSHALYRRHGGVYNKVDSVWTFPGGETVHFGHCQHETDVHRYQGSAMQFVGFDELTTFSETQYKYLISRLRSAHNVPCRLRSATNPGGPGHAWVMRRFAPWLGLPIEEQHDHEGAAVARPGEVLYFTRHGDEERPAERDTPGALGRTFVPAKLADNPYLHEDGEYSRALDELDRVTRERLKGGNWLIRDAPGELFRRVWFAVVDVAPADVLTVRVWDRAATEASSANADPDWTAGLKLSLDHQGIYYIEDVRRFRQRPHGVMSAVLNTAEQDGKGVIVGIIRDPAQAGKMEAASYVTALAGYNVHAWKEEGDKVTRARPASAQAEAGNIRVVRGAWNSPFFAEVEQFPSKDAHDDQVDALSMAFLHLTAAAARCRWVKRPGEKPAAPAKPPVRDPEDDEDEPEPDPDST